MFPEITFVGQVFHQVFWTFVSFLIFHKLFNSCFRGPILSAIRSRVREESLLRSLIKKNLVDKEFYDQEKIVLRKSRKDKIDSYIVKNLSKDEKVWHEELVKFKLETKSYVNERENESDIPIDLIQSVFNTVVERCSSQ